ncbi:HVO_2523 family zinc finger protein [Natrarchaeobius chitinivorans]|uniref:Small CPxCG-related zinc finger protein n=1 Tax=Natrarchaeobius chitinivorans TaxID=1679083 RepID=A0A3N6LMP7_NATCH|nr:HVO_2523 family zinc finger protein [Natrarchaeobius chitinivorans]RQG90443.1 hypothetical protein EA473_21080 [Natrarchaeobius chitinivorans]
MTSDGDGGGGSGRDDSSASEIDDRAGPTCPHCRRPMYERHCKYVCPQHGVIIDCSDPFL